MKRILVPLDGSSLSTSILPDARRLAGPDGTLILVHEIRGAAFDPETREYNLETAIDHSDQYLTACAGVLRKQGVKVEIGTLVIGKTPIAIDEAARIYKTDMIACTTHGRGPLGRLVHGGVAWRAVANSPVPVLLRHMEDALPTNAVDISTLRILVPLDGSDYSETAIPVAADLALQWGAEVYLMRVVADILVTANPFGTYDGIPYSLEVEVRDAREHLENIASELSVAAHVIVSTGGVIDSLVRAVPHWNITHVVMASHGRTGLSRIILGSIADELIHKLHCPIVVVPALAARKIIDRPRELAVAGSAPTA